LFIRQEVFDMLIKLLIISLILVGIVMLTLGIKLWFDPKAEFTVHSCAADRTNPSEQGHCSACGVNHPSHCPEKDIDKKNR
jgi:hypothetical protein